MKKEALKKIELGLITLQSNVIGLFRHNKSTDYEMIVSNEDGWLKCVIIGSLGGLRTNHIWATQGKVIMFDKDETLESLKSNPFKLQEILKEIKKP